MNAQSLDNGYWVGLTLSCKNANTPTAKDVSHESNPKNVKLIFTVQARRSIDQCARKEVYETSQDPRNCHHNIKLLLPFCLFLGFC